MIKTVKRLIEQLTGSKIYRTLPFGIDLIKDIRLKFPQFNPAVVFDVGANIGQTANYFNELFPEAHLYCFEPSTETIKILRQNVKGIKNITVVENAVGGKDEETFMITGRTSDKNRVLQAGENINDFESSLVEQIKMVTLSRFCAEKNIKHIDVLKIDTEGFDLEVVKSGEEMLRSRQIDFIEIEAGVYSKNKLHVPMHEAQQYLAKFGYEVFGFYEQVHEWKEKKPVLRRVNIAFVSPAMYEK